jgi:ribosomal protein S18 acetylase RimI-like enzyme
MTSDSTALLARLERYYDAVPRTAARAEDFGPLTLFVTEGAGWSYYARPTLGDTAQVTAADVEAVRLRQRELGIPEAFEWVSETSPGLLAPVEASGLVAHSYPLLVLDPTRWAAHEPPPDVRVRQLEADDTAVDAGRAVASLAFLHGGVEVGDSREVTPGPEDGSLEALRERMRKGLTITVLAEDDLGPLGSGSHQPVDGVTEIVGVGTVPAARRRGIGAAITSALVGDALRTGVDVIFLSAGSEDVARIYRRLGFVDVGTAYVAEAG